MKSKYFGHDYDARTDEKLVKVRMKHKWSGYGIYFAILEKLYGASGALEADYDMIAFDLGADATPEIVKSIINDFKLFYICKETGNIRCHSADIRFEEQTKRSKTGRENSYKRWGSKMGTPMQTDSKSIDDPMLKSKEEQKKEEKKKTTTKKSKTVETSKDFDRFWDIYPKKKGKFNALSAWNKHKPDIDKVLEALEWQTRSYEWTKENGQYIPLPASYLNAGGWFDERGSLGNIRKDFKKPTRAISATLNKVDRAIKEAQEQEVMTLEEINESRKRMKSPLMTQEEYDKLIGGKK